MTPLFPRKLLLVGTLVTTSLVSGAVPIEMAHAAERNDP